MLPYSKGWIVTLAVFIATLAGRADAHFVWVASQESGGQSYALLFFGEGPYDREYHLPDSIAEAKLQLVTPDGRTRDLETEVHQVDGFYGLRAPVEATGDFAIQTVRRYGVYYGTLLTYTAKHIHARSPADWSRFKPAGKLPLEIVPAATDRGIECTVLCDGNPLADASITLFGDDEPLEATTDTRGRAVFAPQLSGTIGILANFTDKSATGKLGDDDYDSATFYTSLVLDYDATGTTRENTAMNVAETTAAKFPPLPVPVASFGGAVHDGWLYVYSGHTGGAHEHSRENLLQKFVRLKLDGGTQWQELPMQTPLQGHPLVAHGEYLYRAGGMVARNAPDEEDELYSVDEFSRFDPRSNEWHTMPPLPEPRSSHDAVVLGDTLYVIGGWVLDGPGHGEWHATAWAFDLADPDGTWEPLPEPPFARRALAVAHWHGKVVALGGMTDAGEVSSAVDFYDPATHQWTPGPELPGNPDEESPHGNIAGFGVSAWNLNVRLYASGVSGVVYQLADDGRAWREVATLKTPRFFHRLLPGPDGSLLAVGGASFTHGHLDDTERVNFVEKKVAAESE